MTRKREQSQQTVIESRTTTGPSGRPRFAEIPSLRSAQLNLDVGRHETHTSATDGPTGSGEMETLGKTFSTVFHRPLDAEPDTWRIRNSGVQSQPHNSRETSAVLEACASLGIRAQHRSSGSPANADSYTVQAVFLDGGLDGETGNYWYAPRGVWVRGCKAVLLIALQLGLSVRQRWYQENGLTGATLDSLKRELAASELGAQQEHAAAGAPRRN